MQNRKNKRNRIVVTGWAGACLLAAGLLAQSTRAASPELDLVYADGQVYYMIGAHAIENPNPNQLAQAEELYVVVYPVNPTGATNLGPVTLPSGYQPQCDPCFHPGLPPQFVYHDHVLTGAPGLGKNGTAGEYKAPWKIILLMYRPDVVLNPQFQPIKSEAELDAAEAAGKFIPINPGGENPYEIETGTVLICPLVSAHA